MKSILPLCILLFSTQLLVGQLGDFKLTEALNGTSTDTYGTYCGIVGTPPESRKAVEKMIKDRNIEGLSTWLDSPNIVKKTYAAEAFIRLSSEILMTPELLAKIERLKASNDIIPTCHGCVYDKLSIAQCLSRIEPGQEIDSPHDQSKRY